jgi:hypothetical protein
MSPSVKLMSLHLVLALQTMHTLTPTLTWCWIEVLIDGSTTAYDGTDGMVTTSSSSEIWYGGIATAYTYRNAVINGALTAVYKSGHYVSATLVDSSGSELFEVGSHITDGKRNGKCLGRHF